MLFECFLVFLLIHVMIPKVTLGQTWYPNSKPSSRRVVGCYSNFLFVYQKNSTSFYSVTDCFLWDRFALTVWPRKEYISILSNPLFLNIICCFGNWLSNSTLIFFIFIFRLLLLDSVYFLPFLCKFSSESLGNTKSSENLSLLR